MRHARKAIVMAAVMVALVLAGLPTQAGGWLIEPGVGVGPVKIGMSDKEVVALLGEPDEIAPGGFYWWSTPLRTATILHHEVIDITTLNDGEATGEGLHTGSTMEAVRGVFGMPCQQNVGMGLLYLVYREGIVFAVDNNPKHDAHYRTVAWITVLPAHDMACRGS